jgi:hypothetical protein
MRILVFLTICALPLLLEAAASESKTKVEYVGGTMADVRPGSDIRIDVTDPSRFTLVGRSGRVEVPYSRVNQLEYGQKVGRNILPAIVISPLFLLQKTRKHFLTVGYLDAAGNQQAVVFRVSKGDVRPMLASLEARTGLRVTFLDDEARKM